MKTPTPIHRDDELIEAASRWVIKIDEDALTRGDEAALHAWLEESDEHRAVLFEVAAVWDKCDALAALADLFPHAGSRESHGSRWSPWPQWTAITVGMSAVVACVLLLIPRPGADPATPMIHSTYETEVGGQKTVVLPDGSDLVLNTNTRVTVMVTRFARVLRLAQGEILVRVAQDPDRPLSVLAAGRVIQALGTEFVVEITPTRQVDLMVTEGEVVIGVHEVALASSDEWGADLDPAVLPSKIAPSADNTVTEGQWLRIGPGELLRSAQADTVDTDDLEVRLSWTEGRLVFRSEPLDRVLQEVERYTMVTFVLTDENLKHRTLTGRFRAGDVDALLASLRVNFQINHEFDGEGRVLLSTREPR